MKKFVIKTTVYTAIVLAVTALLLTVFNSYYWYKRVPLVKKELVEKSAGPVSLVLGSSHTFYGVNSTLIAANCYNMASTSQTIYEDFFVLKDIAGKHKVDFIVLPISYFSNGFYLQNVVLDGEYMRVFDYEKAYGLHYPLTLRYMKSRFILYTELTKAIIAHSNEKSAFDAYGVVNEQCTNKLNNISDSIGAFARHHVYAHFETRNPYLDSIINLCAQKNIKLNIVVMPFTSGYNHQLSSKGVAFEAYLASLRSLQLNNYKFIDCRNLITENEPVYFRDADHLSPCGRDSLSRYLGRNIIK